MKTIKIFLASSEELKEERKELADIVANLNHILSKRDIFVDLVKWEYMDASMGASHKQEEYNAELRECELCIVIYWTRFGKYTKMELETAYNELKEGHNPRKLYVYFKDDENLSEELRAFKDSFPSAYGHFSTDFGNIDTLKAHFLLQFLEYMSSHLQVKDVLEIRDSQVTVNGQTFVNLANVPFAGNNEEYNLLLKNIKKTKKLLSISEPEDPEYSEYAQELQELEKKLAQMENSLWDTALMVTRLSSTKQSERLQRAMDLFNSGDNKGAMAVLKEEDIDRDVQHNLRLMELGEEGKKGLKTNIEEYTLRIKTLKNDMAQGWGEEVMSLHGKILELATMLYEGESLELAKCQNDASDDYDMLGKFQDALEVSEKALNTRLNVLGENHPDVAESYNNVGVEYGNLGDHQKAMEYLEKALNIRLSIFGENHPDVAESYNNVGLGFGYLGDYQKALEYTKKALIIWLSIFGENHPKVALSYNNVGLEYGNLGDHQKALEYSEKALNIRLSIFGENHPGVAISYNNIGAEYGDLGNYRKALEYMEKALKIWLSVFGENHPTVSLSYKNIGLEYGNLGDHQKAVEHLEKALIIWLSIFGENHPKVALFYGSIGDEYGNLGDHRKALEYSDKALKIRLSVFGENHPDVATSYNNVGSEYGELGDHQKELEYRTKGLEIARSIEDVNLEANLHNRVGKTYQKMGDIEHAMEHFKFAADMFKELGNENEYKENIDLYNSSI